MKLVRAFQATEHPKPGEYGGRITRFTIDVDIDAVHDYIFYESKAKDEPWPVAVVDEIIEQMTEWAGGEEFVARLAAERGQKQAAGGERR